MGYIQVKETTGPHIGAQTTGEPFYCRMGYSNFLVEVSNPFSGWQRTFEVLSPVLRHHAVDEFCGYYFEVTMSALSTDATFDTNIFFTVHATNGFGSSTLTGNPTPFAFALQSTGHRLSTGGTPPPNTFYPGEFADDHPWQLSGTSVILTCNNNPKATPVFEDTITTFHPNFEEIDEVEVFLVGSDGLTNHGASITCNFLSVFIMRMHLRFAGNIAAPNGNVVFWS